MLFILIAFAQVRFSVSKQSSYIEMAEFFIFQLANASFSFILTLDEEQIEQGKKFLNIQSNKGQDEDPYPSNRIYLNEVANNNENLNSHNNSLQINQKKKNNPFDQSSFLDNQLNNCKRTLALNYQENLNDISEEYAKNKFTQQELDDKNKYFNVEYDKNKEAYILKNERKDYLAISSQISCNNPFMHYFSKSLNLISIGIILINSKKQLYYKNKIVNKFVNVKKSNINILESILMIPLQMFKEQAQKELEQNSNKSDKKKNGNREQGKQKKEINSKKTLQQQKEDFMNMILDEQNLKMQKLRKPQKQKFLQQEKYGQVIYNQYESSKTGSDQNINSLRLRRIATVEVMSTENNSQLPQMLINSNFNQDQIPNILSNSNNYHSDENIIHSYHKVNSNVSNKNINGKNLVPVKSSTQYQRERQQSPFLLNSENILQELNATVSGVPLSNVSLQNLKTPLAKSIFNQAITKGSLLKQQGSLNQIINQEDIASKLTQCLIPENIDKLFQHKNLILEDIVDYLLINSQSYKQQKYNTDYLIYGDSEDDLQTHKNKKFQQESFSLKQNKFNKTIDKDDEGDNEEDEDNENGDYEGVEDDEENNDVYDDDDLILEKSQIEKLANKEGKSQQIKKSVNAEKVSSQRNQRKKAQKKKRNHQKLYSYFIQNNYLHIHTSFNQFDSNQSENDNQMKFIEIKLSVLSSDKQDDKFILIELSDVTKFKKVLDKENLDTYKNKILSSVSHELRTPLNCSIQLLDLLSQNDEVSEMTKQVFINPALYSNYLLLNIINDILDLAQINYGQFRMTFSLFELKKIITECLNLISLQAMQKNLDLEFEIDPQISQFINSDANRLRQVLLNLLNNALKFTQKGKVTIRATLIEENLIQIDVEDTGCGIKKKDLDKIIGRFDNNEDTKQSSINSVNGGLGLTIANNLATGLGGNRKLKVQSSYRIGSTFSFCIVNHSLNQIGCTYKQTNLFSKQIINWECFSQYSQNLQSGPFPLSKNKSDFISIPNNTSSIKKKNDPKYNEATMSLMRFNTEIMYSNINMNTSVNKQQIQQQQNGFQHPNQKGKELTNYDVYSTIMNAHNVTSEGGRFNRKFQLSMKTSQNDNQDHSVSETNSPNKQICNNTNGNLTQKQFVENFTELQKDDSNIDVQYFQNIIETSRKKLDNEQLKPLERNSAQKKNSQNNVNISHPQSQVSHHQSLEKSFFPQLFDNKHSHSMPQPQPQNAIVFNNNKQNQNPPKVPQLNEILLTNENDNSFEICQNHSTSPQKIQQKSWKKNNLNSDLDSCNIPQYQIEQVNKNIPNSLDCLEISHKRNHHIHSNSIQNVVNVPQQYNLENSLFEFDQEDQVIRISFKDDKEKNQKNHLKKIKDETELTQIYEKSNEHLESAMSSHRDALQQNKRTIENKLKQLHKLNEENLDLEAFFEKTVINQDADKQKNSEYDKSKNSEFERLKENELDEQSVSIKITSQQEQTKRDLVRRVTMTKLNHIETYPNNYQIQEIKLEEKDLKAQLLQFNEHRQCKCSSVLIVDDHEFNLYVLELRLKSYGFIIDKATSGMAALELVQKKYEQKSSSCKFHKLYQVIFMDIDMPTKNGYETTQDILQYFKSMKENNPTPISACSAYVQESEKIKAKQSGMMYYITKPINQQSLEIVLKQTILDNNDNYSQAKQ